jgi:integral membrane sensor domain MASE1
MDTNWKIYALKVAGLAGAYYVAAKLGLSLAFETESVTAVWPPTGIALAALVLWGYRLWPGVALGALLANSWTGIPLDAGLASHLGTPWKRWRGRGSCSAWRASGPRSTGPAT